MDSKVFDARNQNLSTLSSKDVPNNIEEFLVSHNNLTTLDFDFFFKKFFVSTIDLSYNQFNSLSFLRCFRCISFLDISNNFLDIDDLFDIRNCVILRLVLNNNNFEGAMNNDPLLVPTIVSHAWVINGDFITDQQRQLFRNYESTLEYGNSILTSGRFRSTKPTYLSTAQAGKFYISNHDYTNEKGIQFSPSSCAPALMVDESTQYERIQYLSQLQQFELREGDFQDYFGLALGLLSKLWIDEKVQLIPRSLCRAYFFNISEDIIKMENWELTVLLLRISDRITASNEVEEEIWESLGVDKYLHDGALPLIGSTARLILSAFIARAIVTTDDGPSDASTNDLRVYFKYRKSCGFTKLETSIESVYMETVAPFYTPNGYNQAEKNDKIEYVHPLTNEWSISAINKIKNGRIFILAENQTLVVQIPVSSIFWDGRGVWREMARRGGAGSNYSYSPEKKKAKMFITAADMTQSNEINYEPPIPNYYIDNSNNDEIDNNTQNNEIPIPEANFEPIIEKIPIQSGNYPFDASLSGRSFNAKNSILRSTTVFAQPPVSVDEKKMMPGWRKFRGIVDPPSPKSQRSNRRSIKFSLPYGGKIKDVINVIKDQEYVNGKQMKKFNVKIYNELTKKTKYIWIAESEISKEDANQLNEMYNSHVANKMKTVPSSITAF